MNNVEALRTLIHRITKRQLTFRRHRGKRDGETASRPLNDGRIERLVEIVKRNIDKLPRSEEMRHIEEDGKCSLRNAPHKIYEKKFEIFSQSHFHSNLSIFEMN